MSEAERELLMVIAKAIMDDPNMCQRVLLAFDWNDPRVRGLHGYGDSDVAIGRSLMSDLIEAISTPENPRGKGG